MICTVRPVLQSGAEILVDDFDPEAHAQQTLVQKAEEARNHAACMLRQTKVCLCMISGFVELVATSDPNGIISLYHEGGTLSNNCKALSVA